MTVTIAIHSKKAIAILKSLKETGLIQMMDERIPAHWSPKKKKRAMEFLEAYRGA